MFKDFKSEIKLLLIVAAVSVAVVVAGVVLLRALQGGGYEVMNGEQQKDENPLPAISLEHQGKVYEGVEGSYCWPTKEGGVTICDDKVFPESDETISVRQGDEVQIVIEAAAPSQSLSVSTFRFAHARVQQVSVEPALSSPWEVDHPVGTYFVLVFASWKEGDVSYGFKLDIQPRSTRDTSDWQTYRNNEFGFEVQYPPAILEDAVEAQSQEDEIYTSVSFSGKVVDGIGSGSLFVKVFDINSYALVEPFGGSQYTYDARTGDWLRAFAGDPNNKERVELKEVTSNGLKGVQLGLIDAGHGSVHYIFPIVDKDIVVDFIFGVSPDDRGLDRDQILSTFRFVD